MTARGKNDLDPFLQEALEAEPDVLESLTWLGQTLAPIEPTAALRDRLLHSIELEGRLAAFATHVARIVGVTLERASQLLERVDDPQAWKAGPLPGLSLYHIEEGPHVGQAIVGFIRLQSGTEFPVHRHVGDETVVVLQGSYENSNGTVVRTGDEVHDAAGSKHGFRVLDGPDLVYLSLVFGGIQIGDDLFGPDDPRL